MPRATTNFEAQKWYTAVIPYVDFLVTDSFIQGFVFMSSNPDTAYFDYVVLGDAPLLDFPLKNGWTSDTAVIASAMDHSIAGSSIIAWTGEKAEGEAHPSDPTCRKQVSSTSFSLSGQYQAPSSCGGSSNLYLSYDGHRGIDYSVVIGTPVYAAADGTVIKNDCPTDGSSCENAPNHEYGAIYIEHSNGYQTRYLHLSETTPGITKGSIVTKGQQIGKSGKTSKPSEPVAPHLHFGVADHGIVIDPYGWYGSYKDPYRQSFPSQFNYRLWK